jgi:hypothetical protein
MERHLPPPGRRTEVTPTWIPVLGAIIIIGFGIFAFSFWPESPTLKTDATGDGPNKPGQVSIPTTPPPPPKQ